MQGERTSVESLPEAFDIDQDHTSRSASDQLFWNNVLNPPSPDFLLPPEEPNISYAVNINRREENKIETGSSSRRGGINLNQAFEGEEQELLRVPRGEGGDRVVAQNGTFPVFSSPYLPPMEQASGRRLLGKRKAIEGDPGQSSGSVVVQSFEGLNPRARAEQEDIEGLNHRSFRARLNPGPHQADAAAPDWQSFSNGQSSAWLPSQQSSLLVPASQTPEARLIPQNPNSQIQPLGFPISRASPASAPPVYGDRSTVVRRNSGNFPIHGHIPVDWSLNNGSNLNPIPGNQASSSVNPRANYQNLPDHLPRNLSDFIRRTFPNVGPGVQPGNPIPQSSSLQSNPQDISPPLPGAARGSYQHPLLRSAFMMDRRAAIMGAPLALRTLASSREGRSRLISEHIRNALDLMRRGENLRFEDVLILDHSAFYGLTDLHDRHRDMRLDVDNMTYEELLALEERIGNVSTGLSEEVIAKHLRRSVHLSSEVKADAAIEPCCVCQEDYADGEDIGTLDCGHEFHSECIKQWLAHKNICPICKLTALVT